MLGIIARKPIHLLNEEERKQVPKIKDLWLDIGAKNKDEVLQVVRVGDPITVELRYQEFHNGRAVSAAMDDKTGLWVVMEALRRVDRSKLKSPPMPFRPCRRKSGCAAPRPVPSASIRTSASPLT